MPRRQKKYHYIYKTTNIINGKFYIGMHSTDNLNDGYLGSGKRLKYSINKHGRDNHKLTILEFVDGRALLKEREKDIITDEILENPLCINLAYGGGGGWWGNQNSLNALKHDKESAMAATKARILKWQSDEKFREEYRKELSNRAKSIFGGLWSGKKHKPETIEKMKKSAVGKHSGDKNSQYGTCWVFNETDNKSIKIKKENLKEYISEGWKPGRKM